MTIEEFIAEVKKRPLPSSRLGRVQTLAKELVEGNIEGLWDNYFLIEVYFQEVSFWLNYRKCTEYQVNCVTWNFQS